MKRISFPIFTFFLLLLTNLPAQNTKHSLISGKIVYEINFPVNEQRPQAKESMPKEMTLYFKEDFSRTEVSMPTGTMVMISDFKAKVNYMLMQMGTNKMAIKSTEAEVNAKKSGVAPKVTVTRESKVIAGYSCYKAIVTYTSAKGERSIDVWFTNQIHAHNSYTTSIDGITGVMLEFESTENGHTMKLTAKSVEPIDILDPALFQVPADYKIMNAADMMKGKKK
jgi:GLPGLI family protein